MNTRTIALTALAFLGIVSFAPAAETKGPPLSPLKPAVSEVPFMISYWCGPPKAETTVERYKELAECGFNVAFPAIDQLWEPASKESDEHLKKYLDVCQQAGMKALIWDGGLPRGEKNDWGKPTPEEIPQIEKALDALRAKYAGHPAFQGFVLGDEMGVAQHPRLGVINQYLLKKDPKSLPYYNLLPLYAFKSREAEYQAMVQDYIDTVKPALMSWDHYRQMFGGGDESTYWANLELMRKKCTEAGIPFNQIIVSLKHMGYRECSEADLRWQVYTSLAFGSRGIQYFTYWFTKGLAWADAPSFIDKNGKRDRKYDFAKKINNHIAKLGPTLMKLVCTGAYCSGNPMPPGAVPLPDNAPVKKIEGGRVVVGCFQSAEGKRYIFPVNRTMGFVVTTKLTLDEWAESVSEVSQDTGELLPPTPLTDGVLELKLQPGYGQLFLINDKK